jgi:hypothetical protein
MSNRFISDLIGTAAGYFKVALTGGRIKDNSGDFVLRNAGDSADAALTVSQVNISGDTFVVNSDAAGSGADWKVTFNRATSGMTAHVTYTLPVDDGTPSQVLQTDGNGVLSWASASSTAACNKVDTTSLAFGSTSPVAMFSTGASDVINSVKVVVDTPFNGTSPTMSVGISGTTSKYMASTQVDLKTAGIYEVDPGIAAAGAESLIITYAASSSSAGAARVLVEYATPS